MPLLQSAEAIGAEIKSRLETRTEANGAETDLGRLVFLGHQAISDDQVPCCTVIEGADEVARVTVGTRVELTQRYLILAFVECSPLQPNEAGHRALRDIKRALFRTNGKPDVTFGHQVPHVEYLGRELAPRADGAAFICVGVEIAVTYAEDLANP